MNFFMIKNLAIAVVMVWSLLWKCYSVWTAVKKGDKKWFVALVLFNTLGILDMIYVFYVAKKKWPEVKGTFMRVMSTGK